MPTTNTIVNGDFNAGNTGWSGTDLETSYAENAYLGNGSANRVAETDGFANQITVMQQSFTVSSSFSTSLTFRTALRTASLGNAGTEGFVVSIVNSSGTVISTQTVLPTSTSWNAVTLPVTFPAAGTYTVRFTEVGPNDSLGAIVDDVALLVCFATGTRIKTDHGPVQVEDLRRGDLVWTADHGFQPIRWINRRTVTVAEQQADPRLCPVEFAAGALGPGLPRRALRVSPQHRVCLSGWQAELHFGQPEVMVPAHALTNGHTVRAVPAVADVTYVHFLLDQHQVVKAEGLRTESFFPSALSMQGVDRAARAELLHLFPGLRAMQAQFPATARPVVRPADARLVA